VTPLRIGYCDRRGFRPKQGERVEYIGCPIFRIEASGLPIDVSLHR
jgi:hypothetical protein